MYPQAFIDYLIYFHAERDYFECHEVLEHYWKTHGKEKIWAGLIQLAVAMYHYRRHNYNGALTLIKKSYSILAEEELENLGFNKTVFLRKVKEMSEQIAHKLPYQDMNLPIADVSLYERCLQICQDKGLVWQKPSDLQNEFLIHKHIRRRKKKET